MSGLRAIMVDLDGTLANTAHANQIAYTAALAEAGVTVSKQEFDSRVQGRHWREFLPDILGKAGSRAEAADIARRKGEIYAAMASEIEINVALVSILKASRHRLKTALVTSAARSSVTSLLAVHGLDSLFDLVVTGDDVTEHKPSPEAYQLAARKLEVEPQECVVFEDSDVGIASAKAFGAHVLKVLF